MQLRAAQGRLPQTLTGLRYGAACLHMLAALVIVVDAVGDALTRGAVVGLLAIAGHGGAQRDHDARVVAQLVERQVEGRVLARLNQQLVYHRPHHRPCSHAAADAQPIPQRCQLLRLGKERSHGWIR